MVKKFLCVCTLSMAIIFQSATVSCAENKILTVPKEVSTLSPEEEDQPKELSPEDSAITQEEFEKQLEQLKKDQEQLKKDLEQLTNGQEQLKKDQEQLKKDQEQLKKDQEQLKKDREKMDLEEQRKKLTAALTGSTYLKYIKDLGYYKSTSKTDENLNIRNALLLFQSNHNISVTGKWDDATKTVLTDRLLSKEFTYADTVKEAPSTGKWIVVNKTKRTLTLYENKKVLKKYAVAVGNPASLTKSGKFIINMKIVDPDWGGGGFAKPVKGGTPQNPLGSRWLGINRTDGSYGIHGTNSFYSIGTYASHGCIRMQNYCVEELYTLVSMKTNVWVGTQDELSKWGITQPVFKLQQ